MLVCKSIDPVIDVIVEVCQLLNDSSAGRDLYLDGDSRVHGYVRRTVSHFVVVAAVMTPADHSYIVRQISRHVV